MDVPRGARPARLIVAGAVLSVAALPALVGCGGSSVIVRSGPPGSTIRPASPPEPPPVSSSAARPPASPVVSLDAATGLRDGQTLQVTGSGFSPNETLQVIECVDKGTKTGPGDCDFENTVTATTDATGQMSARLEVSRGPFGINKIVCGAPTPCLVSVTQASLSPTEEADVPIAFGN